MEFDQYGFGQPITRREDVRFVTGRGGYLDDLATDAVRTVLIRSPYAHARINAIHRDAATAAPGVLAVLTGEDWLAEGLGPLPTRTPAKNSSGEPVPCPRRPALAVGRVRYVGDAVVMVVAEKLDEARNAAELVEIDYTPLPAVVSAHDALAEGAPKVWDLLPDNVCVTYSVGDAEAVAEAMARAAHVVSLEIDNQRVTAAPMETRGAIGTAQEGALHLVASSQNVHANRADLAKVFGVEPQTIRVTAPDIGGGFGAKNALYPEHALVLWAAKVTGRAVKWVADRSEGFVADTHGRDQQCSASLALDADGSFLALKVDAVGPIGPYLASVGPFTPTMGAARTQGGPYNIPALHYHARAAFTNTVPTEPYRGAGRPEASYLMERLVDVAARRMGIDPADLRRRNMLTPEMLPHTSATGLRIDSGNFPSVLDQALEMAEYDGFAERARETETGGKLRGIGIGAYLECTGGGPREYAQLAFASEGVTLAVGTHSAGMGHETVLTHLVAARLGIAMDRIRFVQGDSDATPFGGGHGGSRSLEVGGAAVSRAVEAVIERGKVLAAEKLEVAPVDLEFIKGGYRVVGADIGLSFADMLARLPDASALDVEETFDRETVSFPNGCQIAEVEVDPETGAVTLLDLVAIDDFGRIVNPLTAEGQVAGGVAQGIGQALLERIAYDEQGQLLSGSFIDYAMPLAVDLPGFTVAFDETCPAPSNPLGVKGSGEAGCCGAPAAVVNAVMHALRGYGIEHIDMPLTPCKIWQACAGTANEESK